MDVANARAEGQTCTYETAEGAGLHVYVYIKEGGKAAFENQRKAAETVGGIGDGALYFKGGGMYVLKGDALLNMTTSKSTALSDESAIRDAAERMAKLAASRM